MKKGFTSVEIVTIVAIIVGITILGLVSINNVNNAVPTTVASVHYPEPTDYVIDSSHVLSQDTVAALTTKLRAIDDKVQIAVLTVPSTQPLSIEEYGINLADKWGVGHKGVDNGVILIVATADRKIRIEVGRGVEDKLNDSKAGAIIRDSIAPQLKLGDWNGGITAGVDEIIKAINK